jgi:hypothetical protein
MTKIIKTDGNSYLIDFGNNMQLWFDTWLDENNEFTGDWNKYIFYTNDHQDMQEKAFQDANNDECGAYNFATALELCESEYLNNK